KNFNVMGAETHGMAQRGGSVVSHLRLGDVRGSLVQTGTAQVLLALEENEGYRNLPFLAPGGGLFVNTSSPSSPSEEVKEFFARHKMKWHGVPGSAIALSMGASLSSNLALLGFFSAFGYDPFTHDNLRTVVQEISPDRFREKNLDVFDAAFQRGTEENI
ncbi:MAG: 2-oxoacid:acceptor oxidoreductase family protein, partial [Deltaproteobacteria bacterium]|nr:2-oxoacid:acceptor oxidoreductase family protein [Deltaproteobacteria bacterium]